MPATRLHGLPAALLMIALGPALAAFGAAAPNAAQPRNGLIAFTRTTFLFGDDDTEVFSMAPDGSGVKRLSRHPGDDYQPTWSPSGRKLAFVGVAPRNRSVFAMNADGSGVTRLSRPSRRDHDSGPAWSPDGAKIAFASDRGGGLYDGIWVMGAGGGEPVALTDGVKAHDSGPAWRRKR